MLLEISNASTSKAGLVELATNPETTAGFDAVRAVTPAGLKAVADTKAPSVHSHAVGDLSATGTRDATTFLRGDGTWAVPPSGGTGASTYLIVGPGRPDTPATTGGTITGSEPVGAEYRSTDGAGVGAWVWMKRPTGWVVTDGDTGWRIVNGDANLASGKINVRRINTHVHFFLGAGQYGLWSYTGAVNSVVVLGFVPTGFVPPSTVFGIGRADGSKAIVGAIEVQTGTQGFIQARGFSQVNGLQADLAIWLTSQSWPTTLPGTPA